MAEKMEAFHKAPLAAITDAAPSSYSNQETEPLLEFRFLRNSDYACLFVNENFNFPETQIFIAIWFFGKILYYCNHSTLRFFLLARSKVSANIDNWQAKKPRLVRRPSCISL